MKRSDMIVILEEAMLNNYDFCSYNGASYGYSEILKALEDAGMLPPPLKPIEYIRFGSMLGSVAKCEYHEKGMWEPEDD